MQEDAVFEAAFFWGMPIKALKRHGVDVLILGANQFYRPGMSRFELYDAIRGNLKVGANSVENCELALVVYHGYVVDVYRRFLNAIIGWTRSGGRMRCGRARLGQDSDVNRRWDGH